MLGNRSLPLMIAYVRMNLSNVIPTSAASGYSALSKQADAQAMVSEKVFLDKIEELEAKLAAAVMQIAAGGRSQFPARKRLWPMAAPRAYWYFHGTCAHLGSQCTTMLADRVRFSNRMINSKSPTDVPGGSTKV